MLKNSKKNPRNINIYVQDGSIVYDEGRFCACMKAERGELIKWKSNYLFSIHFGWSSPFNIITGCSEKKNEEKYTIEARVRENAEPGEFKYSVAVYYPSESREGKIFIDDPHVIIPPPTG